MASLLLSHYCILLVWWLRGLQYIALPMVNFSLLYDEIV